MKQMDQQDTKIIKVKDIMRLFMKYDVDYIPVIDNNKKLKGLIDKSLIVHKSVDASSIEKHFFKNISDYMFYPDEDQFLQIVGNIKDTVNFPVISMKGVLLFLWHKKDLLNIYYEIFDKNKEQTVSDELHFDGVVNILPFSLVIVSNKGEVLFANEKFLNTFEFERDIVLHQAVTKFFPKISIFKNKEMLFPQVHSILYRHITWYYSVINLNSFFIYLFSQNENLFRDNQDILASTDKVEVNLKETVPVREIKKSLPEIIDTKEFQLIKNALEKNEWNISKTALSLNIPRQTLQYKITKYKIT